MLAWATMRGKHSLWEPPPPSLVRSPTLQQIIFPHQPQSEPVLSLDVPIVWRLAGLDKTSSMSASVPQLPAGHSPSPPPPAPNSRSSTPQAVATPGLSDRLQTLYILQHRPRQLPLPSPRSLSIAPPALPPSAQLQRQHSPADSTSPASISPQPPQDHRASISPVDASRLMVRVSPREAVALPRRSSLTSIRGADSRSSATLLPPRSRYRAPPTSRGRGFGTQAGMWGLGRQVF